MKSILCCLFLFFALGLKASNDTLTCAQVYNFNVGDTFDYKIEDVGYDYENSNHSWDNVSYEQIVIIGKIYSQSQDTLFYIRQCHFYPSVTYPSGPLYNDTLKIGRLQMEVIFYPAYLLQISGDTPISFSDSVEAIAPFNNRSVNKVFLYGFEQWGSIVFAQGLGEIYNYGGSGDGAGEASNDTTILIYYSQNGETWGTPASVSVGIPNASEIKPVINLFPTVNNGQFKIKMTDSNYQACQLVVYDLAGREIKRTALDKSVNNIDINGASAGMYLWRVINEGKALQTGKLIIQ